MSLYCLFSRTNNKRLAYTTVVAVLTILYLLFFLSNVYAQKIASEISLKNLYRSAMVSLSSGNNEEFEKLIEENPQLLGYKSEIGENLVILASSNAEALRFLIEKGMELNTKDNSGNTPLHYLRTFPMRPKQTENVEVAIKMFLDAGVNINTKNDGGHTPVYNAVKNNNPAIVEFLLQNGAKLDIFSAAELCDIEKIESILSENSDEINQVDIKGLSPIHIVSSKDSPVQKEAIEVLVKYGADINLKDVNGWTPLHYAVEKQLSDAVEILLDKEADIDARTEDGDTPLHIAARYGFWRTALLLVEHGADVNAKDEIGLSPSALAEIYNMPMIVEMLKEHGAKPFQMDKHPEDTWREYLKNPYSDKMLTVHLFVLRYNPTTDFENWYISDVFCARRKNKKPFYIVQIYNGIRNKGFKLGCLIVLNSEGNHLRTIKEERIEFFLMGRDFDFDTDYPEIRKKIENLEIIDLPDINGNGYAEIPTQRWMSFQMKQPQSNSIYLTDHDSIPCVLTIENYASNINWDGKTGDRWPLDDIPFGNIYLKFSNDVEPTILVIVQPFKVKYNERGQRTGATIDLSKSPRSLAQYIWDKKKRTFVGPEEGPNGLWKVNYQP